MIKKRIITVSIAIVALAVFIFMAVTTFVDFSAFKKEKKEFTVKYEPTVGGSIAGQTQQTVKKGKSGQTVTAIPEEGYRFLKWSDTCDPNPTRTDSEVTEDLSAKAIFLKISDIKYEILLIYVTEVQATFTTSDGIQVVADYKMDERDLQLCHMITTQFDIYLNEMFDGLVTFVIDEYYTQEVMREENFSYHSASVLDVDIFAEDIPEVAGILDQYESYVTTCYLNDPNHLLNKSAGTGQYKSACIHLNENIGPKLTFENDIEDKEILLSSFNYYLFGKIEINLWNSLMVLYLHEFTHTVELGLTETKFVDMFHYVLTYCSNVPNNVNQGDRPYEVTKLYLLNKAECDGRIVGIPFTVWTKEVYTINYSVNDNHKGYLRGGLDELISCGLYSWRVAKGCDVGEVVAIPASGCRFVGWSDGVTTPIRTDINIQGDMNITAIFERE